MNVHYIQVAGRQDHVYQAVYIVHICSDGLVFLLANNKGCEARKKFCVNN